MEKGKIYLEQVRYLTDKMVSYLRTRIHERLKSLPEVDSDVEQIFIEAERKTDNVFSMMKEKLSS